MASKDDEDIVLRAKKAKSGRINTRLADYGYLKAASSPGPEAIVKVASFARGHRVAKLIEYVTRSERAEELEFEHDGEALKGGEEARAIYDEWKKDFEKAKPGLERQSRHATHMILSAQCDNSYLNQKRVMASARQVLDEALGERGHDYILVLHKDTPNPHVHVVINNYNREKEGPKLRLNKPELFELRSHFAEQLRENGIEQQATMRKDRPPLLEHIAKGTAQLTERDTLYQAKMKQAAPSVDAFAHRRSMSKAVTRMREEVKKQTLPGTAKRKELIAVVNELGQSLTKEGDPLSRKEVAASLQKLGRDITGIARDVESFKHPKPEERRMTAKQTLRRAKALESMGRQITGNIEKAIKEVEKSELPRAERKEAVKAMKSYQKQVSKALGKGLSR